MLSHTRLRTSRDRGTSPISARCYLLTVAVFSLLVMSSVSSWAIAQKQPRTEKSKTRKLQSARPKLVLLFTVDQMRADYLTRFADQYHAGLRRLGTEGAVFVNAEHHHAMTATAPGHATLSTGMFPAHHGIVGNNIYDRSNGKSVYSARDTFPAIGHPGADSSSPVRQRVDGLGDFLKQADVHAKAFAVSLKDRSAIFTAGRSADAAFWFDSKSGHFVTSACYRRTLPSWVTRFNAAPLRRQWQQKAWEPIAPAASYGASGPDHFPYEADGKNDTFPHREHLSTDSVAYFDALTATPFADELTLIFAESLLVAEQMGKRGSTDFLSISLSAADIAGHAYGPFSKEMEDYYLRLDIYLGDFLQYLDRQIGAGNWVIAFSADHGVLPIPEYLPAVNLAGRRILSDIYKAELADLISADTALHRLGLSGMPVKFFGQDMLLDSAWLSAHGSSVATASEPVAQAIRKSVDVDAVFSRAELISAPSRQRPYEELVRNSFDPDHSPDLIIVTKPGILVSSSPYGTSHLTPHDYDRNVPLIFFGAGICPGKYAEAVYTVDVAPTLLELLGISAKTTFDGQSRAAQVRCH